MKKTSEYEELINKIDNYDIISFDIFDTLLLRNVLKPSDIFKILAEKVKKKYQINDFYRLRVDAEQNSRLEENNFETTLDNIYNELDLTDKIRSDIKKMEIDLEKEFLTFNPFMKNIYDYCVKTKKKIICITDMYLPIGVIKEVLNSNGYKNLEIFLSCDYMKQKRDGQLYEYVHSKKGYDKSKWLHIGDNYESDFNQAKQFGISAYHYKKVSDRLDDNVPENPTVEQSIFYAMVNNNINNGLEVSEDLKTDFTQNAILFFTYSRWLLNQQKGNTFVNFVNDDTKKLKEIFDLICKLEKNKIITQNINEKAVDKAKGSVVYINCKDNIKNKKAYSLTVSDFANSFGKSVSNIPSFVDSKLNKQPKVFEAFIQNLKKYYLYIKDVSLDNIDFGHEETSCSLNDKRSNFINKIKRMVPLDREAGFAGLCILALFVLFFFVPMFVMPDSAEYYKYLQIFNGNDPISSWNVTRGFSFPLVLFIITKIFGDSQTGLLIGSGLFYTLFNILTYMIYKNIKIRVNGKVKKVILTVAYYLLLLFNPITYGYFHALYTEIVAIPLAIISCIMGYKFLNYRFNLKNKKTYIYGLCFILLFIFCWFLKQPYFTIALFPLCIVIFISIFKYKSLKDFLYRFAVLVVSLLFLVTSISVWKNFLVSNGVDYDHGRNNENFLRRAFILGLSNFRIDEDESHYSMEYITSDPLINDIDKEQIKQRDYQNFTIVNVYEADDTVNEKNEKIIKDVIVDKMIMYYDGEKFASKDSIKFWAKALNKYPSRVMNSYYNGYLATIDVYVSMRDGNGDYFPYREFKPDYNHENQIVGLAYTYLDENFLWLYDFPYLVEASKNLHRDLNINENIRNGIINYSNIHFGAFKISYLLLPFILLIVMFCYLFRKSHKQKYEMAMILLGFAFLHIIFHVVMGAVIDRYVFIAFPEIILGFAVLFIPSKKSKIVYRDKSPKVVNGSAIFVIPAYNEEKHIKSVIEDIHKNMPEADIVITNDFSKDKTKEIIESLDDSKVTCLNVPFNMGYAMAVQTGIKYAYNNGYDYVVQFDADGQHLASEAKKLFKRQEETGANIVIGSRFLEKTDYKHPFFRRAGTKMFQIIIKIFCKKNITDPTSGFQLLDRSVIERYAMIGKYPEFPDANLIIEMLLDGYNIEEVSVKMKLNDEGKSMHGGIIKPIKYMINVTYTIMFILLRGRTTK